MILQKRIRKPPQEFISLVFFPLKQKKRTVKMYKKTHSKSQRCSYQVIPSPTKYSFVLDTQLLPGDIALMKDNGTFISDLCLLNKFKRYKEVLVKDIKTYRVVELGIEDLCVTSPIQLDNRLIKALETSDDLSFREWSKSVSDYRLSIESLYQEHVRNITEKASIKKKAESKAQKKAERKINRLFDKYPCVHLKRRFNEQKFHLAQISFNETFLGLLGYSIESFVNIVLKEGIPPIQKSTSLDYKSVLDSMKKQFADPSVQSQRPLKFKSLVIMKCGYIRQISCKMHQISTYENDSFGLDTITTIMSKESPQFDDHWALNDQITQDFMKLALLEDEETSRFSNVYYNGFKHQTYKYVDKVCKVREITRKSSVEFEEEVKIEIKTETMHKIEEKAEY